MVQRHLRVWPFVRYLWRANQLLPGAEKHIIHIRARDRDVVRDNGGLFDRFPVQIDFTPEEQGRGRASLVQMGIRRTQNMSACMSGARLLEISKPRDEK